MIYKKRTVTAKKTIGILVFSKKINPIEIIPIEEIESITEVIIFEIKTSFLSEIDLKLSDNKNKNKVDNIMKLIINKKCLLYLNVK